MYQARTRLFFLVIVLLSAVSCSTPTTSLIPTSTNTSVPIVMPTPIVAPTAEPTIPPKPLPSETPTAIPSNLYLPNGIATLPIGGNAVSFYNLQGQLLGELQSPNIGTGTYQQAVIAGPLTLSPEPLLPPLVYFAFESGGELRVNDSNNISLLRSAPNLYTMIGVPGKTFMAFTLPEYLDIGVRSNLYVGDLQKISTAEPVLDTTNTESYAIKPLAISIAEEQPTGIWYTTVPYGIGGDIVFEPRKTLTYLDLASHQINTSLDMTKDPIGISDDLTWVSYTPAVGIGPISILHNFDSSTAVSIPLKPESDRGAGEAVFSPDNQYIAWKEASGSLAEPGSFHETIRIATLDGNILTEITDSSLIGVSGFSGIGWVIPITWIDPQTLAVEVRDSNANNACILTIKFDGTGLTFLAPGAYIGLLYP